MQLALEFGRYTTRYVGAMRRAAIFMTLGLVCGCSGGEGTLGPAPITSAPSATSITTADQHAAAVDAEANLSYLAPGLAEIAPDADGAIHLDRCPLATPAEILAAAPELRVHANSEALGRVRDEDIVATYLPDQQLILCRVVSEGLSVAAQIIGKDDVLTVINRTVGPEPTEFGAQSEVLGGVMQPWHFTVVGDDYDLGFWRTAWASEGIMLVLATTYESQSVPDDAERIAALWLEQLVPSVLRNASTMTTADVHAS